MTKNCCIIFFYEIYEAKGYGKDLLWFLSTENSSFLSIYFYSQFFTSKRKEIVPQTSLISSLVLSTVAAVSKLGWWSMLLIMYLKFMKIIQQIFVCWEFPDSEVEYRKSEMKWFPSRNFCFYYEKFLRVFKANFSS